MSQMETLKQIGQDVAIACNQPTFEHFEQFSEAGFKSVLNLSAAGEVGSLNNESQQVRDAGLYYANVLVEVDSLNDAAMDSALKMIKLLPKPVLCHCKSGVCAGFVAIVYDAKKCCLSAEEAFAKGEAAGFDYSDRPQIKQFIARYINKCRQN